MSFHLIGHRSELRNPGDYVRLPMAPRDVVAYNDNGTVVCIDGVCPHRGARMFREFRGNGKAVCPYHGWAFRGGEMVVPNREAYPAVVPGMGGYGHEWFGDFLFSLDEGGCPTDADGFVKFLTDLSPRIDSLYDWDSFVIDCPWQVAVENALEDHHIPKVHADTFAPLGLRRTDQYRIGSWSMATYDITDKRASKMLSGMQRFLEFGTGLRYFHLFLGPHACLSSVGGITFSIQHYLPEGDRTRFITRMYKGKTVPTAPDLEDFYRSAFQFNQKVFDQDAEVCEGIRTPGYALSRDEARIKWFRESYPW